MYLTPNIVREGKVLFVLIFKDIAINCLALFHGLWARYGTAFCAVVAGD